MTLEAIIARALHEACVEEWSREPADKLLTLHGVDAHDKRAAALVRAIAEDPESARVLGEAMANHEHPGSVGGTLRLRRDHLDIYGTVLGHECGKAVLAALVGRGS